ncbi:hypothetical protein TL16_g06123 [Triparma laevis f. inornata]|uniref:Uncharacterized protein n=1 Tax=Triparma laevis f. inornata TaxID=1714386 RepID=A0A9W7ECP4_9STRA|nr:hypothetical protein TL16_g06123 [Triparma laevis f. inornata]
MRLGLVGTLLLVKGAGSVECGLGSGPDTRLVYQLTEQYTSLPKPTGQLQDTSRVRIRDDTNNSPTFDSEGVVSGRIEVKPSGETSWGTIIDWDGKWDNFDAQVACHEIANELGYAIFDPLSGGSFSALSFDNTPVGSGDIRWQDVACKGSEKALDFCSKRPLTATDHFYDIGISCKFIVPDSCATCPSGRFSDSNDSSPCTGCEVGKGVSTSGATSQSECTDCVSGTYSIGGFPCMNCWPGRYSSAPSVETCLACEAGKASSTSGANTESTCTTCNSGVSSDDRTLCFCGLGSSNAFPTGQLQDGTSVRIRTSVNGRYPGTGGEDDGTDISPTFDIEGVVRGRIEVKPSGETAWGTIYGDYRWDDTDALVACREIGNELGYATVSGTELRYGNTPDGSGEIWWVDLECSGSEETLESCSKSTTSSTATDHQYDIGITCKFLQAGECEACPTGKFSNTVDTSPCTDCEAGKYSPAPSTTSSTTCLACEPGSYSTIEGSPSCTKCAAGRYSSTPSATSSSFCLGCGAGKASNSTGSSSCIDCKPGTYSSYSASASCTACEAGKGGEFTGAASATFCENCARGKHSTGGSSCLNCEAGSYSSTSSATACQACPRGKASTTPGATSKKKCEICDLGEYTPSLGSACRSCEEDGVSCDFRACDPDQFNNNGKCEDCNNIISMAIIAGSFLSFAAVAWYSAAVATNRKKMMQLKVATTFFQVAELTTLIKVSWPSIVFVTLPFQLPITDTKCLTASSGWNFAHTFYAYIYGPILVFSLPLLSASGTQPRSSERKKAAGLLIVLVSLWYSPLLQTIASMHECFQDPEREFQWFLTTDPYVSCEPSLERTIVRVHSLVFSILVGLGFPLFSFLKIWSLRKAGKLDFDSSFANLFQFYNTSGAAPHFETVQFLRKGLLILALTWFFNNPVVQAVSSLSINGGFLLVLCCTSPFIYYPTSNPKRNLFHSAEVSSTVTCLIGNTLALIGSLNGSDQSFIDLLGGILAGMNITFFILFMVKYTRELEKTSYKGEKLSRSIKRRAVKFEWVTTNQRHIETDNLGREMRDAVKEWNLLLISLEDNNLEEKFRPKVISEMSFAKSRIVAAIRIALMETEEKRDLDVTFQINETFNEERFRRKCGRFQRVLEPVNEDFEKDQDPWMMTSDSNGRLMYVHRETNQTVYTKPNK